MIRLELVILPIALVVFVLMLTVGIWHGRKFSNYMGWSDLGTALSVFGGILTGLTAIALVACLVPFQPHYWFFQEQHGEISSISNRFVDASGDLSTGTYVLTVGDKSLVVEDPRVLNYSVGDDIDLNCLPEWVYGAVDRLNCNIL